MQFKAGFREATAQASDSGHAKMQALEVYLKLRLQHVRQCPSAACAELDVEALLLKHL